MTNRRSLHIGLNSLDRAAYGQDYALAACEADARSMEAVAIGRGFRPTVLLTEAATRSAVLAHLAQLAGELGAGDFFFLTYSGHGSQVPTIDDEEDDHLDETWCLHDTQLIDDELRQAFRAFPPGARVLVLSDSCHSGTVTRAVVSRRVATAPVRPDPDRPKSLSLPSSLVEYRANQVSYQSRQVALQADDRPDPVAVVLVSGCADDQESQDGAQNGAFAAFLTVWRDGAFAADHNELLEQVRVQLPPTQQPELFPYGPGINEFLLQVPLADGSVVGSRLRSVADHRLTLRRRAVIG